MTDAITIALSGLNSASLRLNASASNIANAGTSGRLDGSSPRPYSAQTTQSQTGPNGGVQTQIVETQTPFVPAFDANSPFANEDGLIAIPNVNLAEDIVQLKLAEISYKANLQTIDVASDLFDTLLETFDKEI